MGNKPVEKIFEAYEIGEVNHAKDILLENVESISRKQINRKFEKNDGKTLLMRFVENGELTLTKILLRNRSLDVNACFQKDGNQRTPLIQSVEDGNLKILKMLVEDPRTKVNKLISENGFMTSALKKAIDLKNVDVVKILLENPHVTTDPLFYFPTTSALCYTAQLGNLEIFKLQKTTHELNGTYYDRPLHTAAFYGNFEIFEYLVNERQVSFELPSNRGPLLDITRKGRTEEHHTIYTFLCEILERPSNLITACKRGDVEEVKRLLSLPHPILNKSVGCECALSVTCTLRNPEIFNLLLTYSDLDIVTCNSLNILCDGTKGEINSEMIHHLLQHDDACECVSQDYHNKKFKSVDALGLLSTYGSHNDIDNVRKIINLKTKTKYNNNNNKKKKEKKFLSSLNVHRAQPHIIMYENEQEDQETDDYDSPPNEESNPMKIIAPARSYQRFGRLRVSDGGGGGGGDSRMNNISSSDADGYHMSYLSLSIWNRNWPIFQELLNHTNNNNDDDDDDSEDEYFDIYLPKEEEAQTEEEEEEEIETIFTPLSTFLHILPLNYEYPTYKARTHAFRMFQTFLSITPDSNFNDHIMSPFIGHSKITDPFEYVTTKLFNDEVTQEILKHPKLFRMKEEKYLPNLSTRNGGLVRELVRKGHSKSLEYFIRHHLSFCCDDNNDDGDDDDDDDDYVVVGKKKKNELGKFWNMMLFDSPDLRTRRVLVEYLRSKEDYFDDSYPRQQQHEEEEEDVIDDDDDDDEEEEEKEGCDYKKKILELYFDCHSQELERVREMIQEGSCGEKIVNSSVVGFTPLSIAVKNRDVELVRLLLSHPKIDVNKEFRTPDDDYFGGKQKREKTYTVLQYACMNGGKGNGKTTTTMALPVNLEIINMLLDIYDSNWDIQINAQSPNQQRSAAFICCMSHAPIEVLRKLLAHPNGPCDLSGQVSLNEKEPEIRTNVLAVLLCEDWNQKRGDPTYDDYELEMAKLILGNETFDVNQLTGYVGSTDDDSLQHNNNNNVHVLVLAGRLGRTRIVDEILKHEDVNVNLGRPTPFQFFSSSSSSSLDLLGKEEFISRIVGHPSFDDVQLVREEPIEDVGEFILELKESVHQQQMEKCNERKWN